MKIMISTALFASFLTLAAYPTPQPYPIDDSANLADEKSHEKEVGLVRWYRDLAKVKKVAESSRKPIFMLFQEVPG